jgi:CRP-like cAMP-binding protein
MGVARELRRFFFQARILAAPPFRERDMAQSHPLRPDTERCVARGHGGLSVLELPTPRHNHLLAALPRHDYERLLRDLEPVSLPLGRVIHGAGDREEYLHFLTAGIVSRVYVTGSGASAEFAVTGNEGVIGIASFLGGGSPLRQAVVSSAGYGYRMRADRLGHEFEHDGLLPRLLLRYTHALIGQIGLIAACKRHHSLDQRFCRWILSCLDRLPTNELAMTQGLVADMLGVRREGVTEAAGKLQHAGLIRFSRGHIVVIDRRALEARACECYAIAKREYLRLLADYRRAEGASWGRPVARVDAFGHQSAARA